MTGAENNTKALSRRGALVVAWIKVTAMYKFKTHSRYKSVGLGDMRVWSGRREGNER